MNYVPIYQDHEKSPEVIEDDRVIYTAYDLRYEMDDIYRNGVPPGLTTGWIDLDRYFTVKTGQFTVVTGIPSHGKSEFIDALMVNMAIKHAWNIAYFSPENHPVQLHLTKLIRKMVGKPYGKPYSGTMSEEEAAKAFAIVDERFKFFASPKVTFDLPTILRLADDLVSHEGLEALVIDPWNEIDHSRPANLSETEYISKCLTDIRRFARYSDIHIFIVVHPAKPERLNRGVPPTLYDCAGSAHWYNKTDNGITVFRPDVADGSEVEIHITKVRFRDIGKPTGENPVILNYDKRSGRYSR